MAKARRTCSANEATPELPLPLPQDVERDEHGWARLRLRFERTDTDTARHLLRLGADIEVLGPPELRQHMASTDADLAARYHDPPTAGAPVD